MARPQVTLHFAQSLDGRLGLGRDRPRAILSSAEGVADAHRARHAHDAVLIGIETALHDDPWLTARGEGASQPLRVVLDSALRLPDSARLLAATPGAGSVLVFATRERASEGRRARLEQAGAEVELARPDSGGRVSLADMLVTLGERGVRRLLVEGGAQVLSSFLRERLADRAQIELVPYFLGAPGPSVLGELGVEGLDMAPRLEAPTLERLGSSFCLSGDIAYAARSS